MFIVRHGSPSPPPLPREQRTGLHQAVEGAANLRDACIRNITGY
jgi:hypothetical protein